MDSHGDYLLEVGEMYHRVMKEKETKVDQLTHELVRTHGFLKGTQTTLQELESILQELLEEAGHRSTTYISGGSQIYTSATSIKDVSGLTEERQLMEERDGYPGSLMVMERCDHAMLEDVHVSQGPPFMGSPKKIGHTHTHGDSIAKGIYEDTSICGLGLSNIHVEVDPVSHSGYMMMQEDTRSCMSIHGDTVMSGISQGHADVYSGI